MEQRERALAAVALLVPEVSRLMTWTLETIDLLSQGDQGGPVVGVSAKAVADRAVELAKQYVELADHIVSHKL